MAGQFNGDGLLFNGMWIKVNHFAVSAWSGMIAWTGGTDSLGRWVNVADVLPVEFVFLSVDMNVDIEFTHLPEVIFQLEYSL